MYAFFDNFTCLFHIFKYFVIWTTLLKECHVEFDNSLSCMIEKLRNKNKNI